jgi:hypothetical protein
MEDRAKEHNDISPTHHHLRILAILFDNRRYARPPTGIFDGL